MSRMATCCSMTLVLVASTSLMVKADGSRDKPDLKEYRTVDQAITTTISKEQESHVPASSQPPYLGVHVELNDKGKLVVGDVADNSPAARAGLKRGDLLVKFEGRVVGSSDGLRELLLGRSPGDAVTLSVVRDEQVMDLTATLATASRPMTRTAAGTGRATLGVRVRAVRDGEGVAITQIFQGSPVEKAKLKVKDVILKIDDVPLKSAAQFNEVIARRKPKDTVTLSLLVDGKPETRKVRLTEAGYRRDGRAASWNTRRPSYWTRDSFRLAVILIEYADRKRHPKVGVKNWEEALFSKGVYNKTNATGQPVYGSLFDYYYEQSHGAFSLKGKVFDHVQLEKKWSDYAETVNNRNKLLLEALDKLLARDGEDALDGFDGLLFIYAGDRPRATPSALYWPHYTVVYHKGKTWPYLITNEGGKQMDSISICCHEFGHMLGLPDLYTLSDSQGVQNLGKWCAMADNVLNGRSQHFSAWCKEKLGWIKPCVIDPRVKQKLILAPTDVSPRESYKVLIRPDGSEYLLLENRRKKGFDRSLPAEGLLIWRVVNNRPHLEGSHGIEGLQAARVHLDAVPYPSAANDSFTPLTTPSSKPRLGSGWPVHITNIRKLPDGRITFHIGYEYH